MNSVESFPEDRRFIPDLESFLVVHTSLCQGWVPARKVLGGWQDIWIVVSLLLTFPEFLW